MSDSEKIRLLISVVNALWDRLVCGADFDDLGELTECMKYAGVNADTAYALGLHNVSADIKEYYTVAKEEVF